MTIAAQLAVVYLASWLTTLAVCLWWIERCDRRWRERPERKPMQAMHFNWRTKHPRYEVVRRFRFKAHDGTLVVIWETNEFTADLEFERSMFGGKPKMMTELPVDERCEGR